MSEGERDTSEAERRQGQNPQGPAGHSKESDFLQGKVIEGFQVEHWTITWSDVYL